jgi:hypothetical protein
MWRKIFGWVVGMGIVIGGIGCGGKEKAKCYFAPLSTISWNVSSSTCPAEGQSNLPSMTLSVAPYDDYYSVTLDNTPMLITAFSEEACLITTSLSENFPKVIELSYSTEDENGILWDCSGSLDGSADITLNISEYSTAGNLTLNVSGSISCSTDCCYFDEQGNCLEPDCEESVDISCSINFRGTSGL